uniref:Cuticle globin n=1 Tax=Syngamus trachea TaxID=70241 RepID=Q8WS57_SYNTR|nr:cuticle globin [Syngamus trachea]
MSSQLAPTTFFAFLFLACLSAVQVSGMAAADVKKHVVDSLVNVPLGNDQTGKDFYKYFFTNHPDLRKYFKGFETFTADDVQKSEKFRTLGNAFILAIHIVANTYDNEPVFRAYVRDNIARHVERGLEPSLWKDFWKIWTAFLESKGTTLSADDKAAWEALRDRFNDESQKELAKRGLPHA